MGLKYWTLLFGTATLVLFSEVFGNGRLLVPPQRSSLWRDPVFYRNRYVVKNYDDHTLNCGGFWKMHENDGKCGVCGDAWDDEEPRPNEAGGMYARGVIGRTYSTDKRFIDSVVQVTSSMSGYFEFNICPNDDVKTKVSKDCLDQFPLRILSKDRSTSYGRRYFPDVKPGQAGIIELSLEIPEGLECTQCVLQWRWHGANNYGMCRNGRWAKGCGEQPEIKNCADIAILPEHLIHADDVKIDRKPQRPRTTPTPTTTTTPTQKTTTRVTTTSIPRTTEKVTTPQAAPETSTAEKVSTPQAAPETSTTEKVSTPQVAPETSTTEKITTPQAAPETSTSDKVSTPQAAPETSTTEIVSTPHGAPETSTTEIVSTPHGAPETSTTEIVSTPHGAPETSTTEIVSTPHAAPKTGTTEKVSTPQAAPETSTTGQLETISTSKEVMNTSSSVFTDSTTLQLSTVQPEPKPEAEKTASPVQPLANTTETVIQPVGSTESPTDTNVLQNDTLSTSPKVQTSTSGVATTTISSSTKQTKAEVTETRTTTNMKSEQNTPKSTEATVSLTTEQSSTQNTEQQSSTLTPMKQNISQVTGNPGATTVLTKVDAGNITETKTSSSIPEETFTNPRTDPSTNSFAEQTTAVSINVNTPTLASSLDQSTAHTTSTQETTTETTSTEPSSPFSTTKLPAGETKVVDEAANVTADVATVEVIADTTNTSVSKEQALMTTASHAKIDQSTTRPSVAAVTQVKADGSTETTTVMDSITNSKNNQTSLNNLTPESSSAVPSTSSVSSTERPITQPSPSTMSPDIAESKQPLVSGGNLSSTDGPTSSTSDVSLVELLNAISNLENVSSGELIDALARTSNDSNPVINDKTSTTSTTISTTPTAESNNTTTTFDKTTDNTEIKQQATTEATVQTGSTTDMLVNTDDPFNVVTSRTTRIVRPQGGRFGGGMSVAKITPLDTIVNIDLNIPGGEANIEKERNRQNKPGP